MDREIGLYSCFLFSSRYSCVLNRKIEVVVGVVVGVVVVVVGLKFGGQRSGVWRFRFLSSSG